MDMRFGTWNVRSLYRSGSLKTVSGELAKYKLDLVGLQEVRWDKGGTEPAGDYTFLWRPEGRRPLGRRRRRWEDNIKMDLREIGFGDVDWIYLAQDRDRWRALVNTVMNLRVL
jgi:hypothetical protein